jgi:excinuclease ABC subunit A
VEHDSTLMKRSDWIVDLGPGAGEHGGLVVASGPPEEVAKHPTSGTAAHLRGEVRLDEVLKDMEDEGLPAKGAFAGLPPIKLLGATTHNLKDLDLEIPFGRMTGLCGPSGSGKSTLVLETLVPALHGQSSKGRWAKLLGAAGGGLRTVVVDAAPIGRTPHSVPATYVGLMDPIRELFARTPEARMRGYTTSSFSFNSTHGRCAACEGRGAVLVEMQFLADLWLTCEECDGKRFQASVLEVRHRGRNIADVLEMSVDQAMEFLEHQPKSMKVLESMSSVGLGYLRIGQSSTTLSGGEAQRVKLSSELVRASTGGRSVVVLDEPSTGLAATDTVHLARALARLARRGNAVVLIEHNVDLLGVCDHLIELGPDGGEAGGRYVATGTPQELVDNPESITGPFLRATMAGPVKGKPKAAKKKVTKKKAAKKKTAKKATANKKVVNKSPKSKAGPKS